MERLNTLNQYLAEAQLDPENNELYIEDLKISIEYQQTLVDKSILCIDVAWIEK